MATWCKEKAVLVAVYEEKPRRKSLSTSRNKIKKDHHHHHHHHHLHHHHHHHHHLHVQRSKAGEGYNRRAELLSYSQHLRETARSEASSPHHSKSLLVSAKSGSSSPPHPKSLVVPTTSKEEKPIVQMKSVQRKQPSCLEWKCLAPNIFKCLVMSQAKREAKRKKKKSSESSAKKAKAIMKTFNARTKKGGSQFFSKVMATIQKYR